MQLEGFLPANVQYIFRSFNKMGEIVQEETGFSDDYSGDLEEFQGKQSEEVVRITADLCLPISK